MHARLDSSLLHARHGLLSRTWPLALVALLAATGCRYGWPLQAARNPPPPEEKIAADKSAGKDDGLERTEPKADSSTDDKSAAAKVAAGELVEAEKPGKTNVLPVAFNGPSDKGAAPANKSYPAALASDAWVQLVVPAGAPLTQFNYSWRHAGLEPLFALPPDKRPELHSALENGSPVVAANAAIVIARWGGGESAAAVPRLVATIERTDLKMPLRGAAAESLMTVSVKAALEPTRQLIDAMGDATGAQKANFTPQLHAVLLKVLVRQVAAESDPRFAAALKSPAPEVRLEAIKAFRVSLALHAPKEDSLPPLPKPAVNLCEDSDPRVRIAALGAIAAYHGAQAHEVLTRALDDYELPVRLAAIAALGELGGDDAKSALDKLRQHPSELKRAAVVTALAALGVDEAVVEAAKDKSSHVRQAVAQALAQAPGEAKEIRRQTTELARDLLHDASADVQKRAVTALAEWPLEQAGPVLLAAIAEGGYLARKAAADQLAERWPPAAGFPVSGSVESRTAALAELRENWTAQFGTLQQVALTTVATKAEQRLGISAERIRELQRLLEPLIDSSFPQQSRRQAVAAIKIFGPDLLLALEQLSADGQHPLPLEIYRDVLPEISPVFAALDQLSSSKLTERRSAADTLVAHAAGKQLSALVVCRLAQVIASENDAAVWQSVLAAIANDPSADALQIARMAIGNPTVEVRRRACEYLSVHGSIDNTPLLVPLLADPNTAIVIAAVRALAASGTIDDSAPLVRLLASPDKHVRIEVAITLGKLKCSEGVPALERLSHESEWQIRQRAVTALGECGDANSVPLLMELLDDRIEVQLAAMRALVKITGHDEGMRDGKSPTPAQQATHWQRWYRNQTEAHNEQQVNFDQQEKPRK